MAITINSISYELNDENAYNQLLLFINSTASEKILTDVYQQVLNEESSAKKTDTNTNNQPQTPTNQPIATNVELLDRIRHLKRQLEKSLKIGQRFDVNPESKVVRQLNFDLDNNNNNNIAFHNVPVANVNVADSLKNKDGAVFDIQFEDMAAKTLQGYIELLPHNPQIRTLMLHGVNLGKGNCTALSVNLPKTNLLELTLSYCKARQKDSWAKALLLSLPKMKYLYQFYIEGVQYDQSGYDFLCEAIEQSSITDTNLMSKATCPIGLSDDQIKRINDAVMTNREHFDSLMDHINKKSKPEVVAAFIKKHNVIIAQVGGNWSGQRQGYTPLMQAILSDNPLMVSLILDHINPAQITWYLECPIVDYDGQVIPSYQLVKYCQNNKERIQNILQSHRGDANDMIADEAVDLRAHVYQALPNTKGRETTTYKENIACSLSVTKYAHNTDTELSGKQAQIVEHLRREKNEIREHAARRCDLAFYTFIGYYKKNVTVDIGNTRKTNGEGDKFGVETDACHSALISSFLDQTALVEKPYNLRAPAFHEQKVSILDGTHFFETLNATVQLPVVVNRCDIELEGKPSSPSYYRKQYLELINAVSHGKMTPEEAMAEFFCLMEKFFIMEKKWIDEGKTRDGISPPTARMLVMKYEKQGTFEGKWNTKVKAGHSNTDRDLTTYLVDDYIFSLLRLSPLQIAKCYLNGGTHKAAIYEQAYLKIQSEILGLKNNSDQQVVEDENNDDFEAYVDPPSAELIIDEQTKITLAIHLAARDGRLDIVNQLLDQKALVNVFDHDNYSPLFYACENGCFEMVCLLLQHGASPVISAPDEDVTAISFMLNRMLSEKSIRQLAKLILNSDISKFKLTDILKIRDPHVKILTLLLSECHDYTEVTEFYLQKGMALFKKNEHNAALKYFSVVAKCDPNNEDAYHYIAMSYQLLATQFFGKYQAVVQDNKAKRNPTIGFFANPTQNKNVTNVEVGKKGSPRKDKR